MSEDLTADQRDILNRLRSLADELARLRREVDDLMAQRLALFLAGIEVGLTQRRMAEAVGLTEMAVTQQIRKNRLAQEAESA